MFNYNNFINEALKKKLKPTREHLEPGKMIKTIGQFDGVDLNNHLAIILKVWEYGKILVEFLSSNKKFHAGYNEVGKPGYCFYIPLENINEIIQDSLATKIINKEVVAYQASGDLLKVFRKIDYHPTEEFLDVSFFDVDKNNMEVLTYIPAKKFTGDPESKKGRQAMKVGRVIRKLTPKLTDQQIEELVVKYRAAFKIVILGEGIYIDVVTGEDIRYWYDSENYVEGYDTELHNSCMSDASECHNQFSLYVDNPDKIGLAVYINEDDKLMARALVWKLDDGDVYMDRIYAESDEVKGIMKDYAKKNNMSSYYNNNKPTMEVTLDLDYGDYDRPSGGNPYMDTFDTAVVDMKDRCYLTNRGCGGNYKRCNDIY